ncbi:MAG: P44/Msp2 family outer membrane protein [Pseudomonadota bacterium]
MVRHGAAAFSLSVGLAAFGASGAAMAQPGPGSSAPVDDGPYIRFGAGAAFVSDLEQDFTYNPNLLVIRDGTSGKVVDAGGGLTFAAALGFDYADGIRTELEYRYTASDVDGVTQVGGQNDGGALPANEDDLKAHLIMANFYFDFETQTPFTPFIGGGVGGAFVTNENAQKDAALAYQGRAGVSLDVGAGAALSLEYVYTQSRDLAFGPKDDAFTPTGPEGPRVDGDNYRSSSAMLSFRKRF